MDAEGLAVINGMADRVEEYLQGMLRGINWEIIPFHCEGVHDGFFSFYKWNGIPIVIVEMQVVGKTCFHVRPMRKHLARKLIFCDPVGFSGLLEEA